MKQKVYYNESLFLKFLNFRNSRIPKRFIEQNHRKPQETLKLEHTQPRKTFSFKTTTSIEESWMLGLTRLELYSSFFNITEQNRKLERYVFPDSKNRWITYRKVRDEIAKDFEISDIIATDLQVELMCPIFTEEYRKTVFKNNEKCQIYGLFSGS